MAGYRDTLNLPRTDFPMKADLPNREPRRLEWWAERGVYAKLREARSGAPVWLLHDGPPYSNAHIHMGTAANYVWKDATVRAMSLLGFDSPFIPGWDNHGMPIENQITKDVRARGLEADRARIRTMCREYAAEWVAVQRREFERLGVWGDWEHPYLTMDHGYEAAILESFAALAERGFIQRGLRSIHWCPTDRTALAEAEIEYQDDASPSIHVAFPLRRDPLGLLEGHADVAAIAWTTTPWTLPANLGLMVDPAAEYAVVEAGPRRYLVAVPRIEAVRVAAGWSEAKIAATFKGARLLALVFEGPWGRDSRVVDGTPFVSMEDGTGLVHTAPGHGKEDFAVGQRSGLGVACPVDEAGRFTASAEPFVGRSVLEVNDDIVTWLGERGRLIASSRLTHSYPHCWRCHEPVIFRATKQWFMMIDHVPEAAAGEAPAPRVSHRERALDRIENAVRWDPPGSKNRIRESVRTRPDWCLSRQRSWGVGVPAIFCEACGEAALDPRVMARAAAVTRESGSDAWYQRPIEDFVPEGFRCPSCSAPGPFHRETDILDVWFDAGSSHRAAPLLNAGLREAWRRALAEGGRIAYFEGPDQHRGWFNSSLMVGVGIGGRAPYTDVFTHGWVLDADGRAMHKSLGNVISPEDVVQRYGAEIVRWWALSTDWRSDVRVGDEVLQRVSEAYRKVRNTLRFLLGNLSDFTPADAMAADLLTAVDRVFLSHLETRLARMRRDWEQLVFHRVLDQALDLCTVDLSAVFLDVAKDRLYTLAPGDLTRRSAQTVLWHALRGLAVALSPALVFTTEEVWQSHAGLTAESESVHLVTWPLSDAAQGGEADPEWAFLLSIRDAVNAVLEPMRAAKEISGTAQADVTLELSPADAARLAPYRDELPGFLITASAAIIEGKDGQAAVASARATASSRCERCWMHRSDVGANGLCGRCVAVLAAAKRAPGA
ncbi:MAG: isoleucine--tRNA ligase [Candidatus Eisenbacteria bacterium]|nr:isoleucine--tRNA ligase [Candidatus Eisenbacteria bacterium]